MESEFPPLPSSGRSTKPSAEPSPLRDSLAVQADISAGYRGVAITQNGTKIIHRTLSREGDAILEYIDTDSRKSITHYRWQVSSDSLMKNSSFFSALLDPNKFSEGRRFVQYKARLKESSTSDRDEYENESPERLPLVGLNLSRLSGKHRIESLELFLKVLLSARDVALNTKWGTELAQQSVPVIAGLIEVADLFSSSDVVGETLRHVSYKPSVKGIQSIESFSPSLLKLSEERLRQIIYIAMLMQHDTIFRVASHALATLGSIKWIDGVLGLSKSGSHRWSYLENGIEEELYYRRQCIMNTITDLQAHFLRAFGALEDDAERSRPQTQPNKLITAVSSYTRPLQCRWGFDNSRACDSFHLGEMIRFFSMRSKTIFLGSTLIDPGYEEDLDEEQGEEGDDHDTQIIIENGKNIQNDEVQDRTANVTAADVLSITASLRQISDYQIDPNHTGCGIRRRLLPVLDCVEGFIGHRRALIGLTDVMSWKSGTYSGAQRRSNLDSWKSTSLTKAEEVDVRGAKIVGIRKMRPKSISSAINPSKASALEHHGKRVAPRLNPSSSSPSSGSALQQQKEEARLFFTARKRNWEK